MTELRWLVAIGFILLAPPSNGAVIVVETLADNITGPLCDIGDAIATANLDFKVGGCDQEGDGDDVIDLTGLTGTIALEDDLPAIQSNVTLQAAGPSQLTISGEGAFRVFRVIADNVTIRNMTIAGGFADRGAAVWADPSSATSVRIEGCRITGNAAGTGAAIANDGASVIIDRSLIDGNTATGVDGAIALNSSGTMRVVNSTLSGNSGDGIASYDAQSGPDTLTLISDTTLVRNPITTGGRNLFNQSGATTQISHVLLSSSETSGTNCGGTVTSLGYNISDDATCSLSAVGDLNGTDAGVADLAANGGTTATHALEAGSAALDGGSLAPCVDADGQPLAIDQRGRPRGTDGDLDGSFRCDVGAFEASGPVPEPSVGTLGGAAVASLVVLVRKRSRGLAK